MEEEKRRLCLNRVLFSLVKLVFECEHLFIDKLMVITEPNVPSARLKLVPSIMQCMFHKNLIRFTQSLSLVSQKSFACRVRLTTWFRLSKSQDKIQRNLPRFLVQVCR